MLQRNKINPFAGIPGAAPNSVPMTRGRPAIGPEAPRPTGTSSNSSMSRGRPAIGPEAPTKSTASSLQSAPITYAQLANEARQLQARSVNPLKPSEMWSAAQRNYDPGPKYPPNVNRQQTSTAWNRPMQPSPPMLESLGTKTGWLKNLPPAVQPTGRTPQSTFQTHKPVSGKDVAVSDWRFTDPRYLRYQEQIQKNMNYADAPFYPWANQTIRNPDGTIEPRQIANSAIPAHVQTAWNNFTNPPAGTGGVKPTREMAAQFEQYGLTNQPSQPSAASSSTNRNGYGAFLNLPPGSRVDRRFVDSDGDGIDDRYQSGPGQPRGGGTRPNVPVRPSPIRPTPPPAPTAPTPPPALPNNPSSGINWRKRPRRNAN